MGKYEKSYSNYILRKLNTNTKNGGVYENDVRTINQKFNNTNNKVSYTTDGGFTYVVNNDTYETKKYNTSGFSYNVFTLSDFSLSENEIIDKNNKIGDILSKNIRINKTYYDLSNYCYFGSANAMLNSAINDIIFNFPSGINVITGTTGLTLTTNNYSNPLGLNTLEYDANDLMNIQYDIKTLSKSYIDYELVKITNNEEIFISNITGFSGTNSGTTQLTFYLTNVNQYGSDLIIRPKEKIRDDFFNNLDDFQKELLNRYSIPRYKSKFKIPKENGGFEIKEFIWETSDGYNIDIDTPNYVIFLNYLIDATNYIDEIYNDNLYRMLVHDSIKTLENITSIKTDSEVYDDVIIGGNKIDKLIRLYGKSFDEIKSYIDTISFVNTVTYNKENNIPDEYTINSLNVKGWEVSSLGIPQDKQTEDRILNNTTKNFKTNDVFIDIIRKLIINSKHIFKSKGTVKSLRKIFGIFGFEDSWYQVKELSIEVDNPISGVTLENIAALNYTIRPDIYDFDDTKEPFEYIFDQELFENTNVEVLIQCPICNSHEYLKQGYGGDASGTCDNGHVFLLKNAMVGYPNHINRSDCYFQQKGGWYCETGGYHIDNSGNTYVNETNTGNNPHIGNGEYDSGYDYIEQYSNIFKNSIRSSVEYTDVPFSGYTNNGFDISKKRYSSEKIVHATNDLNKNIINLKNFIIGIDCQKIFESICKNNINITQINASGNTDITIDNTVMDIVYIYGNKQSIVNINIDQNIDKNYKIVVDSETCGLKINEEIIDPGSTIIIQIINNDLFISEYDFDNEYTIVRSTILPYIEQIIPSTTIFDFVKIDKKTPKWVLINQYYDRNTDGTYNGYYVLEYQNVNFFDYRTISYDETLTNLIEKDFGGGYELFDSKLFINEDIPILTENNIKITTEKDEPILISTEYGHDNIYKFRKLVNNQNMNTDPIWVPINA